MSTKRAISMVLDAACSPLTLASAAWLKLARTAGLQRQPISRSVFRGLGIYPIRDHYYDPLFKFPETLWTKPRNLPGINFDIPGQLELLASFQHVSEIHEMPMEKGEELRFFFHNSALGPGDAELYYLLLRHVKPRKIVEVGSGYSSLLALEAMKRNKADGVDCELTCIEPYEMDWLEKLPIKIIRKRVEDCDFSLFTSLEAHDILFIDSSHIIRPGGDVMFEYLEILPQLKPGVYVHVHDIFTPRHYPREWLYERFILWNEQYLLEAFLTGSKDYEVVCSLNHLWAEEPDKVGKTLPLLAKEAHRKPGSFWMRRV